MIDDILRSSILEYFESSKNTSWRRRTVQSQNSLFRFLKENNLVIIEVLNDAGEAIPELTLKNSCATPDCIKLFEKTVAAWERARDKDGDYENTNILAKGLEKIRAGN
jgi:hypothetical protein